MQVCIVTGRHGGVDAQNHASRTHRRLSASRARRPSSADESTRDGVWMRRALWAKGRLVVDARDAACEVARALSGDA